MAPDTVWAEPGHTRVHPEEENAALSQDAHKLQEVLVTQETQAASFSKHMAQTRVQVSYSLG